MSDVKIGQRFAASVVSGPGSQGRGGTSAAPVADASRGIGVVSGAHSHGEFVIQVRQPAPPAPPLVAALDDEIDLELEAEVEAAPVRSWADDEAQDEAEAATVRLTRP